MVLIFKFPTNLIFKHSVQNKLHSEINQYRDGELKMKTSSKFLINSRNSILQPPKRQLELFYCSIYCYIVIFNKICCCRRNEVFKGSRCGVNSLNAVRD